MPKMKRKCTRLSQKEKKEIILYVEANELQTHQKIADRFSFRFKKQISRRSIRDFVNNKQKILEKVSSGQEMLKRDPNVKFLDIDEEVFRWVTVLESKGAIVTDNIIKEKALKAAKNKTARILRPQMAGSRNSKEDII